MEQHEGERFGLLSGSSADLRSRLLLLLLAAGGMVALGQGLAWAVGNTFQSGLWLLSFALMLLIWLMVVAISGVCWGWLEPPARLAWPLEAVGNGARQPSIKPYLICGIGLGMAASLEIFLFSWMFLPVYFRGYALWFLALGALSLWFLMRNRDTPRQEVGWRWPTPRTLQPEQRKVFYILSAVLLIAFLAVIPINRHGTLSAGDFQDKGEDELVMYPLLMTMFKPAPDLRSALYQVFEYDDYHYGFPFYALSAFAVLPSRIVFGVDFGQQYWLNLPLLRMLISVLPILLSALLAAWLGTRFRSLPAALTILLLVLTLPAVLKYQQFFWHPDGLTVLGSLLVLFFLVRDDLRLGPDFILAALLCGVSAAIRLTGFFFFLAVGLYLLYAWGRRKKFIPSLAAGFGFLVILGATFLVSNPFLWDGAARERALATINEKSGEMVGGYSEEDPFGVYQTGWGAWAPFIEKDYLPVWMLAFLLLSCAGGVLLDANRFEPGLILAWVVALGGYLILFVAVKSFQYGLPVMVPLCAGLFFLPESAQPGRIRSFLFGVAYLAGWAVIAWNGMRLVQSLPWG